ncbi:MAG: hypothetical protein ACT4SY_08755 [Hyphomicrobiales bacterium]
MNSLIGAMTILTAVNVTPAPENWCRVGQTVMVPDGREGPVTSLDGDICRVLVYGESYVSLWAYFIIEPVYPSVEGQRKFGH